MLCVSLLKRWNASCFAPKMRMFYCIIFKYDICGAILHHHIHLKEHKKQKVIKLMKTVIIYHYYLKKAVYEKKTYSCSCFNLLLD